MKPRTDLSAVAFAACSPLERGQFAQALLDILAVLACLLLIVATGGGIAFAVFILLFVAL